MFSPSWCCSPRTMAFGLASPLSGPGNGDSRVFLVEDQSPLGKLIIRRAYRIRLDTRLEAAAVRRS